MLTSTNWLLMLQANEPWECREEEASLQGLSLSTSVPSVSAPAAAAARHLASHTRSSAEWWGPQSDGLGRSPRLMSSSPLTRFTRGGNGGPGRKGMGLLDTTKVADVGVKVRGAVQEGQSGWCVVPYAKVHPGLTFLGASDRYSSVLEGPKRDCSSVPGLLGAAAQERWGLVAF